MRKGIVMEQSKKYTIIMTHDGFFHKAKRLQRAEVGMEVHFQPLHASKIKQTFFLHRTRFAVVTMALLLTLFPTLYWFEDNKAFAYVSVDINPSVELEVNDDMEVLDIQALNEDAEKLVSKLGGWKKKPVPEIALEMISISQNEGYLKLGREVLIGVSYINEGDFDFSNEIEVFLNNELEGLMLASYNVPNTIHQMAEQENTSVNKLMAESLDGENDKFHLDSGVIENEDRAIIQAFYNNSLHPEKEKGSDDSQKLDSDESSQIPVNDYKGAPDQHPHSVPQPSAQVKYSETNLPDKPDKDQATPGTAGKEKTPDNDKQSKKRPLSNSNSEDKGNHKPEKKAKSRTDTVEKQSEKKNNPPSKKDENKTDKPYTKNNEKGKADKDQDKDKDKSKADKDQDKDKDKSKADKDQDKDKDKSKAEDKGTTKEKDKNEDNDKKDKGPGNEKQKKYKNNNNGNNNGNEKKK
ncbi:anti-sigma factor domain-containing protein [Halobacillus campisalis]|uniref:Anti-sigma factor domain-containing protein n=1 Tax=Halobacillus campisalis TaxID=435909 RepID=A0ABW2K069_9BACI